MMRKEWVRKLLSMMLAAAMVFNLAAVHTYAEESDTDPADGPGEGKYVKEVFIAYEKTEDKAAEWLEENGWEPVEGDFNAGKASTFDDDVAAVMGIKRTDDKDNAITDMAVMNMMGGYSVPQYEELLKQKKTEIDEFIKHFRVVIEEYRTNWNEQGSEFGKKRAVTANTLLNSFYDGDPDDPVAVNDTGDSLGDLLLEPTLQEGNKEGADLQQIMLESSGPVILVIEALLTLAADPGEESWLTRASGLTGEELSKNLPKYVPEAEGQDVAPSAVSQYLGQTYGDTAAALAVQWGDIHSEMTWFEEYNEENGLWQGDEESVEDYEARVEAYLKEMRDSEDDEKKAEADHYERAACLYFGIYDVKYEGEWGETLGDFFNPADKEWEYPDDEYYLPMAAALSDGQRAGMDFISAPTLILIGLGSEKAFDQINKEIKKVIGEEATFDVYSGVNRAAFRGSVAITNEALMEQNAGRGQAFDEIWDNTGVVSITVYSAAILGLITLGIGSWMKSSGVRLFTEEEIEVFREAKNAAEAGLNEYVEAGNELYTDAHQTLSNAVRDAQSKLEYAESGGTTATGMGYTGRVLMGIGGVILIGAAVVKIVQLAKYYDRDMLPIPRMIVDESDIVTYLTDDNGKPILDENGNQKKNIDFKTFEYYTAVRCNREEYGVKPDWNDGVEEYEDHSCYDIADLNCDIAQEWLALYTVKSGNKGNPILADTLTLKYGKGVHRPKNCTKSLHLFTYDSAVDLGDTAWAYNNDKGGVFFFWGEDENAFPPVTAASFTKGQIAICGVIGFLIGAAGSWFFLSSKRRKKQPVAAQNETTAV